MYNSIQENGISSSSTLSAIEFRKVGLASQIHFIAAYVFTAIRRHKTRSFSFLLGVLIGATLVSSVFVWTDTGARVSTYDYLNNNPIHYWVRPNVYGSDPQAIFPIKQWIDATPSTASSHVVYWTVGLVNPGVLDGYDPYQPYTYARGIKDCSIFCVDNEFLEAAENAFTFTGERRITTNSIIVSQRVIDDAEIILGIHLGVGSQIDLAIATYYSSPQSYLDIGDLHLFYVNGLRIAGIYDIEPKLEPLQQAYTTRLRSNWSPDRQESIFGWPDGIFINKARISQANPTALDEIANRVEVPRLMVNLDYEEIFSEGLDNAVPNIEALFERIEINFPAYVGGRLALQNLAEYIAAYKKRQTMVVLVVPITVLSIMFTIFSTTLFLAGRHPEVALLRARGASYRQLYVIFIAEFTILVSLGLVFGNILGLFVGCLIPAATSFLTFNFDVFFHFLSLAQFSPMAWILCSIICISPPLIFTIITIRSFLQAELYQSFRKTESSWLLSTRVQIIYIISVLLMIVPFVIITMTVPLSDEYAIGFFIIIVIMWVLLADVGARLIRFGVAGFSYLIRPFFGQKTKLLIKSVRAQRGRITPLLLILILTFSITTYSAIEAQTYEDQLNQQIAYYLGADIRIASTLVFATQVEDIMDVPGIDQAVAFVRVPAQIGSIEFQLIGVDPEAYAAVGNWDASSMVNGDPQSVLRALDANPNAIIFPQHIADQINRHTGDQVNISVDDQFFSPLGFKVFDIVGEMHSAPGFGYANPSDPAASRTPVSGFGFQFDSSFAFCHIDYLLIEIPDMGVLYSRSNRTNSFLANVQPGVDFEETYSRVQSLDFVITCWSPMTFDLEDAYLDAYLFTQGVISLLSVSYFAAWLLGIVALTIFVNIILSERKLELAVLRAIGGNKSQVTALLIGEFLSFITAAFILGLLFSSGFSLLLLQILLQMFPLPYVIPFAIEWPIVLLFSLISLVIAGMLVGIYLPIRRANTIPINSILRNL
ncbi:MAG: FtsX-like permease family protein [Promethearchaeota archaeon]